MLQFPLGTFVFRPELIGERYSENSYFPTEDEIAQKCLEIRNNWTKGELKKRSPSGVVKYRMSVYNSTDFEIE